MDHKGVIITPVKWQELSKADLKWIKPLKYSDMDLMIQKILNGEWFVFRVTGTATGLSVGYPDEGRLFIYYLRGRGLFDNLTSEDLLSIAQRCGLRGMSAICHSFGMLQFLTKIGFYLVASEPAGWYMELDDVRSARTDRVPEPATYG